MSYTYAQVETDLIDAIISISNTSIADTIATPTIVITGDQSSGKSALMKRITGVDTPTGDNMMTRCAVQVDTNPRL